MASERLILDSGFALEAILPTKEAWRVEAVELIQRIADRDVDARVPWIFFAECAAVCTRKIRDSKVRLDKRIAAEFLEQIDGLGMHVDLTLDGAGFMHANAISWQCGAYDSIYIDAARRMAIPVATRDKGMVAACRLAKVEVL